jgi:hypothetical protein
LGGVSLENYSKAPIRAAKTHEANMLAAGHLQRPFGKWRLADLIAGEIEQYLRQRRKQHARVKTGLGFKELNRLKPTTVRQEFRVLRRTLGVDVREKLLPANPCGGVEFPVSTRGSISAALRYVVRATVDRMSCS